MRTVISSSPSNSRDAGRQYQAEPAEDGDTELRTQAHRRPLVLRRSHDVALPELRLGQVVEGGHLRDVVVELLCDGSHLPEDLDRAFLTERRTHHREVHEEIATLHQAPGPPQIGEHRLLGAPEGLLRTLRAGTAGSRHGTGTPGRTGPRHRTARRAADSSRGAQRRRPESPPSASSFAAALSRRTEPRLTGRDASITRRARGSPRRSIARPSGSRGRAEQVHDRPRPRRRR